MKIYVNGKAPFDGDGSELRPYRRIGEAAFVAKPGDEVLVYPGIYRESVSPRFAGKEEARITYRSVNPLGAVITGAEKATDWTLMEDGLYCLRIPNAFFGDYNPYTTYVYGDWYFAKSLKHTGCVYLGDEALFEVDSLEECRKGEVFPYAWEPESSRRKWYTCQDEEKDETLIYANFRGANPREERVEITVRRECFFPQKTGTDYITVSGFKIEKAATTWAPPAAFQDGMIGPHWSKGWIIEDCEICHSRCAGISLGKYLDPENDHFFTTRHVKSPTQMERDAVCRGQYHGWLKEKVGSHVIRRCNIHHCQQGGIIGRMGGVFSLIEDNHIHHTGNMQELGGAEIAGIKMHAAIDVRIRRNHIHHCTMGIWCDWEAQGTRISQNLLHDNQRPEGVEQLPGGMMSMDLFVEVGHGPTLIDNNLLLSDVSLRFATQGVALVHNLICGAFTCVGEGTGWRYTPYHIPHRTEVMGFMTILHGDDRFYNNLFIQKYRTEAVEILHDSNEGSDMENREVGTHVFDEYPTYEEWISHFDLGEKADMAKLEPYHFGHLPVWSKGNAYFAGAKAWKKEEGAFVSTKGSVNLSSREGNLYLDTDLLQLLEEYSCTVMDSSVLGKAFEPDEGFENPDGSPIRFDTDYFGNHRGLVTLPGPFAKAEDVHVSF